MNIEKEYDFDEGLAKEYDFDEGLAMDIITKKRVNKPKQKASSKKKYKNVEGSFRNNTKNYQYDYEEDFYEPENK